MTIRKIIAGAAAAASVLAFSAAAQASTWIYTGNNADAKPVSASANITLGAGTISIALSNLGDNMIASNQAISGIFLEFDNGLTSTSAFTQAGQRATLNGTTNTATPIAGSPDHWGASVLSGDLRVWTLTGGPPHDLIAQAAGKNFSGLNNGISSHNPYLLGTGNFTLSFVGGATEVTGVRFLFGTEPDSTQFGGSCTADCGGGGGAGGVPEPATWAMMIIGFGGVGAIIRRRRFVAA